MDDVKLNVITTKYGDNGKTNLVEEEVLKSDEVIELIGTIDEANASIGSAMEAVSVNLPILKIVQNALFDLSADIIKERQGSKSPTALKYIEQLEASIKELNSQLPPLTSFVIPKGRSAPMHLARTIVRRAERCFWRYCEERVIFDSSPGIYLNRLSDLLFVICRYIHNKGDEEELWVKGGNKDV